MWYVVYVDTKGYLNTLGQAGGYNSKENAERVAEEECPEGCQYVVCEGNRRSEAYQHAKFQLKDKYPDIAHRNVRRQEK